jgi:drug/metabolite transporter (DMT)-like permease
MTIVLTLLAWSSVPLFLRHFAESIDAWTSNGWRYGFSALLWAPVLVLAAGRRRLPAGLWRAAAVPSIINAAGQVTFTWAHYRIDPGLLTFGLRSQMVFVAVGAYLLFPAERRVIRTRGYLAGLAALLAGTAAAVLLGEAPLRVERVSGVVLSVASGFFFAAYGLAVRRYMTGIRSAIAFAAISQYTAVAMVVLMLALGDRGGRGALDLSGGQLGLLLLSGLIGIALGHVLFYASIARLGVAVASGVLQLHPFLVSVASFFLFREILAPAQWAGGCVAVGGAIIMLVVQRRVSRREHIDESIVAIAEGEGGS